MSETTETRTCAWTGEEFTGKFYILATSEHPTEIVSEDAFRDRGVSPEDHEGDMRELRRQVNELRRQVQALTGDKDPAEAAPAAKAAPAKAAAEKAK